MKINEFNCISEHNNIDEYLEFYKYVKSLAKTAVNYEKTVDK